MAKSKGKPAHKGKGKGKAKPPGVTTSVTPTNVVAKNEDLSTASIIQTMDKPSTSGRRVRLALSMIMGNEEAIVRRCLTNMAPIIKATDGIIIISCNGSDGTRGIIDKFLKDNDIMGMTIYRPWIKDFGNNRTETLKVVEDYVFQYQRSKRMGTEFIPTCEKNFSTIDNRLATHKISELEDIWYSVHTDADNLLLPYGVTHEQWLKTPDQNREYVIPDLQMIASTYEDRYDIPTYRGDPKHTYASAFLLKVGPIDRIYWEDPLHEYVVTKGGSSRLYPQLANCWMYSSAEGDRNRDPAGKDLDDYVTLQRAISSKGDKIRWWYYSGKSLRDYLAHTSEGVMRKHYLDMAVTCFKQVIDRGDWLEERYMACYHAATIIKWYGGIERREEALGMFLKCLEFMAERRETLWHIVDLATLLGKKNIAWPLCKLGWKRPRRTYLLEFDDETWTYKFPLAAASCAWDWGEKDCWKELTLEAVNSKYCPEHERTHNLNEIKRIMPTS